MLLIQYLYLSIPNAVQSTLTHVSDYLKTVPPERQEAMTRLRDLCVKLLTGFEETMAYGMPAYKRNDVAEVAFNSQKQYISLYILRKDVLDRYRSDIKGVSIGKGCIRYTKPAKLDFEIVKKILTEIRQATGIICP